MSIIEKMQRERRRKQENAVNRVLMALKYQDEPIDVTKTPLHELIDVINELNLMPADINPARFAAMVKNAAAYPKELSS